MSKGNITARDILNALDTISGGRVIRKAEDPFAQGHPFVVTKSSNIPGKAVCETPGLVCGDPGKIIKKLAVSMTLTESQIELAGATGVDAVICHHPVADAASCGGVPLRGYLALYGVAVFELHEAFHGRHPGIALLHGHRPFRVEIAYGGVPGNVMFVGKALPEVKTVGDILDRLVAFTHLNHEMEMLEWERKHRGCPEITEAGIAASAKVLLGSREDEVGTVLHFFPHTGFSVEDLKRAKKEHPDIATALVSISRVKEQSALVDAAKALGLKMIVGNSHALEILENGLPLAYALKHLLPVVEVVIFRERVTSTPLQMVGSPEIKEYARQMAEAHLLKKT
jgi:putative NIF3 family GTP cyclohydrolase 1 type 2